jgi:hypothetical protein
MFSHDYNELLFLCNILHCFTWICRNTGEKTGANSQNLSIDQLVPLTGKEKRDWHFPPLCHYSSPSLIFVFSYNMVKIGYFISLRSNEICISELSKEKRF